MDQLADYSPLWHAFLLALVIAALVTPLVIVFARRIGAIDTPDAERRVHEVPTPRLGGIAMLVAVLITTGYYVTFSGTTGFAQRNLDQIMTALACGIAVSLLGAWDDWRGLGWKSKLLGQVGIASAAVLAPLAGTATSVQQLILPIRVIDLPLVHPIHVSFGIGAAVAILSIVALMNMLNFIDGVDGLAAGISAISAATFAIIAASYERGNVAILAAATSGSSAGFLIYNFARGGARIFMGDAGSMLLGFLLAVIGLQGVLKTAAAVALLIPLALLAIPILDTVFVVLKRLKHRQSIASADKWHLHHRMLNVGYSPRRVTVVFWLWTASLSALALAMRFVNYGNSRDWNPSGLVVLGGFAVIAIGFSVYLATVLEIIKSPRVRARNARARDEVNGSRDQRHLSVVPEPEPIEVPAIDQGTEVSTDGSMQPPTGLGSGHDRPAGIATDPRDDPPQDRS